MARTHIFRTLFLWVTLAASGCAPRPWFHARTTSSSEWELVRVLVRNQHPARIDIFVLHDRGRFWIGRVEPGSEGYFDLDAAELTGAFHNGPPMVRLEVKPWGPQFAVRTDPVRIRRGRTIDWLIKPDLRLSRLTVH